MKKRIIILIFIIEILSAFVLTGCGGSDDWFDDFYEDDDEWYDDDWCEDDWYDDDYEDDGWYDEDWDDDWDEDDWFDDWDDEYDDWYEVTDSNLAASDYALGTCGEMDGVTLLISIYLNDSNCSWSDGDEKTKNNGLKYTQIATDWISNSVSQYGCEAEFIYDWKQYSDLYYEGTINKDMLDENNNSYAIDYAAWEFIDDNIDSKALLQEYNADNICYLFFINSPDTNEVTSCTRNYYRGMEYPYEMCFIHMHCMDEEESPAGIAHEILHTFGAPDLYKVDTDGDNYGVSRQLVRELEQTYSNDIMFTTYDARNYTTYYNKITNDFTDVDAYYVGIIDYCEFVEIWGLDESQH